MLATDGRFSLMFILETGYKYGAHTSWKTSATSRRVSSSDSGNCCFTHSNAREPRIIPELRAAARMNTRVSVWLYA